MTSGAASRAAIVAGSVGGLSSVAGFVASCWIRTGTTPVVMYEYFADLRSLSPGHLSFNVPVELLTGSAFGIAVWSAVTRRVAAEVKNLSVFLIGVVTSAWFGIELSDHGLQLGTAIAGFASGAMLILVASTHPIAVTTAIKQIGTTVRSVVSEARARAAALVALCAVMFSVIGIGIVLESAAIEGVTPGTRNFARWFKAQGTIADSLARQSDPSGDRCVLGFWQYAFHRGLLVPAKACAGPVA